jgi:hypothetical protein
MERMPENRNLKLLYQYSRKVEDGRAVRQQDGRNSFNPCTQNRPKAWAAMMFTLVATFLITPIPQYTNVIRSIKTVRKVKIRKSKMEFPLILM